MEKQGKKKRYLKREYIIPGYANMTLFDVIDNFSKQTGNDPEEDGKDPHWIDAENMDGDV